MNWITLLLLESCCLCVLVNGQCKNSTIENLSGEIIFQPSPAHRRGIMACTWDFYPPIESEDFLLILNINFTDMGYYDYNDYIVLPDGSILKKLNLKYGNQSLYKKYVSNTYPSDCLANLTATAHPNISSQMLKLPVRISVITATRFVQVNQFFYTTFRMSYEFITCPNQHTTAISAQTEEATDTFGNSKNFHLGSLIAAVCLGVLLLISGCCMLVLYDKLRMERRLNATSHSFIQVQPSYYGNGSKTKQANALESSQPKNNFTNESYPFQYLDENYQTFVGPLRMDGDLYSSVPDSKEDMDSFRKSTSEYDD